MQISICLDRKTPSYTPDTFGKNIHIELMLELKIQVEAIKIGAKYFRFWIKEKSAS